MNEIFRVKIMCQGKLINEHSECGYRWVNPFGKNIPMINDIVELGFNRLKKTESKKYIVIRRKWSSEESMSGISEDTKYYENQECIIYVKEFHE